MSIAAAAVARTVAAFESASELREAHARLLEELDRHLGEDASSVEEAVAMARLEPEIRRFLERGAATGVYLEEPKERTRCQILLDYWVSSLVQAGLKAESVRLARFDAAQLPDLEGVRCPYVGLEAFRDQDQTYFFGRESDTRALIAQWGNSPLIVVLGASGSGKSSFIMGGVLPRLASAGEKTGVRIVPPFVPGNAVLEHLAEAVLRSRGDTETDPSTVAAALRENPQGLLSLIGAPGPMTLITIDQFEEVFTLSTVEDREALVASLVQLLEAGHSVILTVREEFRSRIVELRALSPYLEKAWYAMRPMDYDELRAAVEKPAALANLQFQTGVVDDLVKKVLGQPAALPLLQFTLRLLWEERDRNRVTWEVYNKVGDPLNALKASADGFYDGLAPQTQLEVRRALLELVRVDDLLEAYRQPVPMSRLLEAGKANTGEVIGLLAKKDYVRVTPGATAADAIVEVKHESLVRNWPRFVGWIDEKRIERRQRLSLTQAALRWAANGKPTDAGLLTGWQLEEAKSQPNLSAVEEEFVQVSSQAVERTQQEREDALRREAAQAKALVEAKRKMLHRTCAALILVAVAALAIAWAAYHFWQKAEDLDRRAETLKKEQVRLRTEKRDLAADLARVRRERDDLFAKGVQQTVASEDLRTSSQSVTIYLHISKEEQRQRAREIERLLEKNGVQVPGIQKVSSVSRSDVRYFRPEDEAEAREIAKLLIEYLAPGATLQTKLIKGFENQVPGQQYEIWFAPDALRSPEALSGLAPKTDPGKSTGTDEDIFVFKAMPEGSSLSLTLADPSSKVVAAASVRGTSGRETTLSDAQLRQGINVPVGGDDNVIVVVRLLFSGRNEESVTIQAQLNNPDGQPQKDYARKVSGSPGKIKLVTLLIAGDKEKT